MEDFTERHFLTPICIKEQGIHPPNQPKMGKAPWGTSPCLAQGLPHKGGGQRWQLRVGCSPLGASLPILAVAVPPRHAEAVECMLHAKYSF
jgi:hypothetical protein